MFSIRFFLLFCFVAVSSCKKNDNTQTTAYSLVQLTGNTNNTWHLKSISMNGQLQNLTSAQKAYGKIYKYDGSWTDTDGYIGTYQLLSYNLLKETTTNNVSGGNTVIQYNILLITSTSLTLEYTLNQVKYKLEFSV